MPQVEAMLAGKPIISTGYGGVHEYLDDKNAILLPYKMIPVHWPEREHWYSGDQNWADVNVDALQMAMRAAFEGKLKQRAAAGKKKAQELFSFKRVGQLMAERLQTIENSLPI
jgi:glycosyltransferase involved in cell wall biosynthesis